MVNVCLQARRLCCVVSPALMKPFGSGATDFSAPGWGVCCGPSCEGCMQRAARGVAWASAVYGGCRAAATDSSLGRPERCRARNWTVWGLVFLKKQKPLMLSSYFLALTPMWVMNCFQQHDKENTKFTVTYRISGFGFQNKSILLLRETTLILKKTQQILNKL